MIVNKDCFLVKRDTINSQFWEIFVHIKQEIKFSIKYNTWSKPRHYV